MNKNTPRIIIPPAVRKYVFERDHYCCQGCKKTNQETELTIDHIIPLTKGGSNDISNLQTLCRSCNVKKRDNLDSRFQRRYTD